MSSATPSEIVDTVILFRLSVGGSDAFAVYATTEPGHFRVGSESGPWLAPVPGTGLLSAVVAVAAFDDDAVDIESVEATSAAWGEGQIAEALLPALDARFSGGTDFTIDDIDWTCWGNGFAHPEDFDQSSIVLAEDSWSNHGQGMPMMADSGTYLLVKLGSRYLVVHNSEGSTSLEKVLTVVTDEAAIREFEEGWTSQGDPDTDDESDSD